MTASPKSTAVAEREESIGTLPPEIQQAITLRRMANVVAAELAKLSWGQSLDQTTRRTIAEWGRVYHVDVTTEIDVLGNRLYLNSRYYLRRLAGLIEAGVVEYAFADHLHPDKRLEQLTGGEQESQRRLGERIRYNIPDAAVGAVAFRVKLRNMEQEVVGCSWCGGGTRKADPVGDQEPVKTAESRAARRAMRLLVSHVPTVAEEVETVIGAAAGLEARIKIDHDALKKQRPMKEIVPMPTGSELDDGPRKQIRMGEVKTEVIDPASVKKVSPESPMLHAPDPYADDEAFDRALERQDRGDEDDAA